MQTCCPPSPSPAPLTSNHTNQVHLLAEELAEQLVQLTALRQLRVSLQHGDCGCTRAAKRSLKRLGSRSMRLIDGINPLSKRPSRAQEVAALMDKRMARATAGGCLVAVE